MYRLGLPPAALDHDHVRRIKGAFFGIVCCVLSIVSVQVNTTEIGHLGKEIILEHAWYEWDTLIETSASMAAYIQPKSNVKGDISMTAAIRVDTRQCR